MFSWWSLVFLTSSVHEELTFCQSNFGKTMFNGLSIMLQQSFQEMVYFDASGTGFGGFVVSNTNMVSKGNWTKFEQCKSSTCMEGA